MLKNGVLDPQGKAIAHALGTLGFTGVQDVRAGKVIELELAETDPEKARAAAEDMARKLLANTVIESFAVGVKGKSKASAVDLALSRGDGSAGSVRAISRRCGRGLGGCRQHDV